MNPTPLITTVPDHYDRRKNPRLLNLAVIPPSAFVASSLVNLPFATYGTEDFRFRSAFKVIGRNGCALDARINGAVKTWKRSSRIKVPCKYGFRECFYLESIDGITWLDVVPYRLLSASDDQEGE
jgi:hypothetical protein